MTTQRSLQDWEAKLLLFMVAFLAVCMFVAWRVYEDRHWTYMCRDGTKSHSVVSQGACSWHGGIAGTNPDGW